MFALLIAFVLGVIMAVWGSQWLVMPLGWCVLLSIWAAGLWWCGQGLRWGYRSLVRVLAVVLMLYTGQQYGQHTLQQALALRLTQPLTTTAVVTVQALSDQTGAEWRQVVRSEASAHHPSQHWLLSLPYAASAQQSEVLQQQAQRLRPHTRWRVQVRLKPIHGQVSAGAFDLESWLLGRHIQATGVLLSAVPLAMPETTPVSVRAWVNPLRLTLREHLATFDPPSKGVLLGLLTGDRALIDADTQQLYRQTGISHLLAISGPHVLLAATVLVWLWRHLLNRWPTLYLRMERRRWELPVLLLAVLGYAMLAGWELPAQRTVLMVTLVCVLSAARRRWSSPVIGGVAVAVLLLGDPLAALSAAFWLSFGAVALLMLLGQRHAEYEPAGAQALSGRGRWRSRAWASVLELLRTQLGITLLMLPLVLVIFGQFSWLSVPVNLLAIPLLGVVVVGLNLLALLLWSLVPAWGDALWAVDLAILDVFHAALTHLVQVFPHALQPLRLTVVSGLALVLLLLLWWLPRGVVPRWLAVFLLLPLCAPRSVDAPLTVQVLDVGQGLSVLVQTRKHVLLFDTGAKRPDQREGMGERVVLPALYSAGIRRVDALMISHADNDHAGGANAVLNAQQVDRLYGSQALPDQAHGLPRMQPCRAGDSWTWDGVDFAVLAPWPDDVTGLTDNDGSCVLKITAPANLQGHRDSVLLTGDAGQLTEQMLALLCVDVRSDVLVLGHHGSQSSSGMAFLQAVAPQRAVVSAGFMNRYGHPAPAVLHRLRQQHIAVDSTIDSGTLIYRLGQPVAALEPERWRDRRPWWTVTPLTVPAKPHQTE